MFAPPKNKNMETTAKTDIYNCCVKINTRQSSPLFLVVILVIYIYFLDNFCTLGGTGNLKAFDGASRASHCVLLLMFGIEKISLDSESLTGGFGG